MRMSLTVILAMTPLSKESEVRGGGSGLEFMTFQDHATISVDERQIVDLSPTSPSSVSVHAWLVAGKPIEGIDSACR